MCAPVRQHVVRACVGANSPTRRRFLASLARCYKLAVKPLVMKLSQIVNKGLTAGVKPDIISDRAFVNSLHICAATPYPF